MAALMAVWTGVMQEHHPSLESSTYADDRVVWIEAPNARHQSQQALEEFDRAMVKNRAIERSLQMKENDQKRAYFAQGEKIRKEWKDRHDDLELKPKICIVGFEYTINGRDSGIGKIGDNIYIYDGEADSAHTNRGRVLPRAAHLAQDIGVADGHVGRTLSLA